MIDESLDVGVVGVGSMGQHHARVYTELPATNLVGVVDADDDRAREIAETYGTTAVSTERLLAAADAVSVAVPDHLHYGIARRAIDRGVHLLVEKPFVDDPSDGRDLIERARRAGLVLQVGHVERFNPAVQTLQEVLADCTPVAIQADRLGPPVDRQGDDDPVRDLMVHDVDVVRTLLGEEVRSVQAARAASAPYVTALLTFDSGVTARLTASRATQQKVRTLSVTAEECRVTVDYLAQSVEIHRRSVPEYVPTDGDVRYRHEGVIERPTVDQGEPLKNELRAFVEAVRDGGEPPVTGEDGLAAMEVVRTVQERAERRTPEVAR